MKHKVLKQDSKKEGKEVVVTKTIEEKLTKDDILNIKQQLNYQKENLLQQVLQIQERIDLIKKQESELDGYLIMLGEQQPK